MSEFPDLDEAAAYLRRFAAERDWECFYTSKNLSMALAGEAGELLEIFQWMIPRESTELDADVLHHAGEELVDILEIGLNEGLWDKVRQNAARYPADEVRGRSEERIEHRER